jgi:hypothetical protein
MVRHTILNVVVWQMSTAHSLYLVTAPHYQLQSLQPSHSQKLDNVQSWLHLQRSLLRYTE